MAVRLTLLALTCAFFSAQALTLAGTPVSRRAVLVSASSSLAAIAAPQRAHADAIEDIAARSNAEAARQAAIAEQKKKDGNFVGDLASSAFNVLLTGATLAVVGGGAAFFLSAKGDADKSEFSFGKDDLSQEVKFKDPK